MTTLIYDIECYPNVFTLTLLDADSPLRWCYEISDWRNDSRLSAGKPAGNGRRQDRRLPTSFTCRSIPAAPLILPRVCR